MKTSYPSRIPTGQLKNTTPRLAEPATLSFKVILLSPVSVSEKAGALSQKGHTWIATCRNSRGERHKMKLKTVRNSWGKGFILEVWGVWLAVWVHTTLQEKVLAVVATQSPGRLPKTELYSKFCIRPAVSAAWWLDNVIKPHSKRPPPNWKR